MAVYQNKNGQRLNLVVLVYWCMSQNESSQIFEPHPYRAVEPAPPNDENLAQKVLKQIGEFLGASTRGVLLAFLLIYFVAQAHIVHGHSMEPNLHTEQRLIVEKLSYRFDVPQRQDVVVIERGEGQDRLIKRVIGLPGEMVEIRGGQVFINGRLLDEPYLPTNMTQANFGPKLVPPDQIFVLGDNRNNSNDSRYFGTIPVEQITGRAWLAYWPFADIGFIK